MSKTIQDTPAIWAPKKSRMANDLMERMRKNSFNRYGLCREDITREPKARRVERRRYDALPPYAIGTLHTKDQLLAALASMATGNARVALKIKEIVFYPNTNHGGGAFDGKMLDAAITEGGRIGWSDIMPITRIDSKFAVNQFLGILVLLASWEPKQARELLKHAFLAGFFDGHLAENERGHKWMDKYTTTQLTAALALLEFGNASGDAAILQRAEKIVEILHKQGGVLKDGFFYPAMDGAGMRKESNAEWLSVYDQLLAVVLYSRLGEARKARGLMNRLMNKTDAFDRGYFNSILGADGRVKEDRTKRTDHQFAGILAFNALRM